MKTRPRPAIKFIPLILGFLIGGEFFIERFTKYSSNESLAIVLTFILTLWLVFVEGLSGLFKSMRDRNDHLAKESNLSVTDFKSAITKDLSKLNKPIIIIIDDIDRLQRNQILTIMQLIKSNADFENIVFLLLYSKTVLEKKITDNTQTGHEYMEKIVQVEFKVPEPDIITLRQYLVDKLSEILDKGSYYNSDYVFDDIYFSDIFYHQGLDRYFKNLRAIYKFLNSFEFNLSSHLKNNYLEVNFVDFLVIETFRIFEPKLYSAIHKHRSLVLGNLNSNNIFTNISEDEKKNIASSFIDDFCSNDSIDVLKTIFPNFQNYFQESLDINSSQEKLLKNMISHESRFDRYFNFEISPNEMPIYKIMEFFENLYNYELTKNYLKGIYEHGKFSYFIENLIPNIDKINNNEIYNYFKSLGYLYDIASNEEFISEKARVGFLFSDSLKFFKYQQFDILNNVIDSDISLPLIISIDSDLEKRSENYNLNESEIRIIQNKVVNNIENLIKHRLEEYVLHERRLSLLLFWYKHDQNNCKSYISYLIKNPSYFFQIYKVFIRHSKTVSNGIERESIYVDKELIANFIELDEFENLLITNSANSTDSESLEMKDLFYQTSND